MPNLSQDCPSYCGDAFPTYVQPACNTKFKGGSNKVVLFKCNTDFNTDLSADAMGVAINAMIDAGEATLLTNVMISSDAPSDVTGPSYVGCVPDTYNTSDVSYNLIDRNVSAESREFYQTIRDNFSGEIGGMMIYECANDRAQYIPHVLTLGGGMIFPDQKTDLIRWAFTLTGQSSDLPYIFPDPPVGVFTTA